MPNNTIDLTFENISNGKGRKHSTCAQDLKENTSSKKKLKLDDQVSHDDDDDDDDDDEIEIMDKESLEKLKEDSTTRVLPNVSDNSDEEIQMVGIANEGKCAHSQSCSCVKF